MSIYSTESQTIRIRGIVQSLRQNGISIPKDLSDEIKLLDSSRTIKAKQDASRQSALNDLSRVPADEYEEALAKAQNLWAENDPVDQFANQVEAVQYKRVFSALYNASGSLMSDIEGKINDIVDAYKLNEVRLPHDLANYDVMRSTPQDLEAISAYRQAAPSLNILWGSYKNITTELGHDLQAREFSSALDVAFLVSDVDTFHSARDLANQFEVLRMGVDSMKNISQLGIWGLVNLAGNNIEMKSLAEAQYLRGQAQASIVSPAKTPKGKVTILS